MSSPYRDLPATAFWSKTAALRDASDVRGFYSPKTLIGKSDALALAGSCFAQHVGRALQDHAFNVLDFERLPPVIPREVSQEFGYCTYSARYGNIYTIRQMKQLLLEAFDHETPTDRVWENNGRFYDAQRPSVDPGGLGNPEDVLTHRQFHLKRVRQLFARAEVFVFTFGLTEAWCTADESTVFPTAPGTIAGAYDPEKYIFKNFRSTEIREDFLFIRNMLKSLTPNIRFLLTVSPVPLTATATGSHVEVATSRSKAVLRTVCAELYDDFDDVDYYPSYEIITAQAARGMFFAPNLRSVRPSGVDVAVGGFISAHSGPQTHASGGGLAKAQNKEEVICEEMLLDGFAQT